MLIPGTHRLDFFRTSIENQITGSAVFSTRGFFSPKSSTLRVIGAEPARIPQNEFQGICPISYDVEQGFVLRVSYGQRELGSYDVVGVERFDVDAYMILDLRRRQFQR